VIWSCSSDFKTLVKKVLVSFEEILKKIRCWIKGCSQLFQWMWTTPFSYFLGIFCELKKYRKFRASQNGPTDASHCLSLAEPISN
jgi:hypothetical protein